MKFNPNGNNKRPKTSPSHDIHVIKFAFGGTFLMMKMNLKAMIELA